jgi:hypothetical protein
VAARSRDQFSGIGNVTKFERRTIDFVNTGGAQNAFDVFMGKGGEGAQTNGCSKLYSSYPGTGEPYGGGIRAHGLRGCAAGASETRCAPRRDRRARAWHA